MQELVRFSNGLCRVSTNEIAFNFGKAHRDDLRAIELMECTDDFRERNFAQSYYTSKQGKKLNCFDLTRDGFAFLCMGFTGKMASQWKEKYIDAFNRMEIIVKGDINEMGLIDSLNAASLQIDDLKAAGSAWGKSGAEIRKHKKVAIEGLYALLNKAQLQLGFDLI